MGNNRGVSGWDAVADVPEGGTKVGHAADAGRGRERATRPTVTLAIVCVASRRRSKLQAEATVEENSKIVWEKAETELLKLVQVTRAALSDAEHRKRKCSVLTTVRRDRPRLPRSPAAKNRGVSRADATAPQSGGQDLAPRRHLVLNMF